MLHEWKMESIQWETVEKRVIGGQVAVNKKREIETIKDIKFRQLVAVESIKKKRICNERW